MSSNKGEHANRPLGFIPAIVVRNTDDKHAQTVYNPEVNSSIDGSSTSAGDATTPAPAAEQSWHQPEPVDLSAFPVDEITHIQVMRQSTFHVEEGLRRADVVIEDVGLQRWTGEAVEPINEMVATVNDELRQLGRGEDNEHELMNQDEPRPGGVRRMAITHEDIHSHCFSLEDIDALDASSNSVSYIPSQLFLSSSEHDGERPDVESMSLDELDAECERLIEEYVEHVHDEEREYSDQDLDSVRKRFRRVTNRQKILCHFPSDHSEKILGKAHIQDMLSSSGNLPRFLFRGSNLRSGGNNSDSESSRTEHGVVDDDDDESALASHTVRMINSEDRVVPHAHFADPQMLNHPRCQTFDSLLNAADYHTSARRFNTPFTSWTCDFETAIHFAIGHFPNDQEADALQEAASGDDWVFHESDMPAIIGVLDTWTVPDRHMRIFHQPALAALDDAIPSEYLVYGELDRADGIDLRGVSVQELRARLRCPKWPQCPSRVQLPHQPSLQDALEAWTVARAYMQDDADKGASEAETIDMGLVVLAAELARQQWQGFPPRPDGHVDEARVRIEWPPGWLRLLRRFLERISPGPLGARMSGVALANPATPYVGFPQFRLMQQLLLSWAMDYPDDVVGNGDAYEDGLHVVIPPAHSCTGPALLDLASDLELVTHWSEMVKRDRDGDVPVPPAQKFAENVLVEVAPIETGVEPQAEAPLPMQHQDEQQQLEPVAQRVAPIVEALEGPLQAPYWPAYPRGHRGLRPHDEDNPQRGGEVSITLLNVLLLLIVLLLVAEYFCLVLAVY